MSDFYDDLETRDPEVREADLFGRLSGFLANARQKAPAWGRHLAEIDPGAVGSRADMAAIPVFRKERLLDLQSEAPPFGGLTTTAAGDLSRLFMSPGPIYDPEGRGRDWWGIGRTLFAAGVRPGDIIHNTFSYHLTPAGHMFESGAHALGCAVIPAGTGNTEMQLQAIAHFRPRGYAGTPDYLKILLDKAAEAGADVSSIARGLVGGAALPASLRQELKDRGVSVSETYGTADLGLVAYQSGEEPGMIVNENLIVEIVRPGSDEPVADGEVGEVVVTRFNDDYPLIRFATGDMSAVLAGPSPCGRTNMRIKGWMGRADQRTKIRGMFVDPKQVNELLSRHREVGKARLVVGRENEQDVMHLIVECAEGGEGLADSLADSLREVTKLRGTVEIVAPGALPNDGKVIADERPIS